MKANEGLIVNNNIRAQIDEQLGIVARFAIDFVRLVEEILHTSMNRVSALLDDTFLPLLMSLSAPSGTT